MSSKEIGEEIKDLCDSAWLKVHGIRQREDDFLGQHRESFYTIEPISPEDDQKLRAAYAEAYREFKTMQAQAKPSLTFACNYGENSPAHMDSLRHSSQTASVLKQDDCDFRKPGFKFALADRKRWWQPYLFAWAGTSFFFIGWKWK